MRDREARLAQTPCLVEVAETLSSAGLDADDAYDTLRALVEHKDFDALVARLITDRLLFVITRSGI